MKLNIFSKSFFFIIFLILYSLIFFFSDKKISKKNNSEIRYHYDVWGNLRFSSLDSIISNSRKSLKIINNKYFNDEELLTLSPKTKLSKSYKIAISNQEYVDLNKAQQPYLVHNTDLVLSLSNNILFYYDLMDIHFFLQKEFNTIDYKKNNLKKECKAISQNLIYLTFVDNSTNEFRLRINQKQNHEEELKNKDLVFNLMKKCFHYKTENLMNVLNWKIDNYFNSNEKILNSVLEEFVTNNNKLLKNQENINQFKNDILKIFYSLRENFRKINNDIEYSYSRSNISVEENFQKKINIYTLSFILNFMMALTIFYLFFFLRNSFTILKKIFN